MKAARKIILAILDFIEVILPVVLFGVVFVTFVIQIVYRYIANIQMAAMNEVTMIAFTTSSILAGSYGTRKMSHVAFGMVRDHFPVKLQRVIAIVMDLTIIVFFCMMVEPTWATIKFYAIRKTSVLKYPFQFLFAPYLYFILSTIGNFIYSLIGHCIVLWKGTDGQENQTV